VDLQGLVDNTRSSSVRAEAAVKSRECCPTTRELSIVPRRIFGVAASHNEFVVINGRRRLHGYRIRTSVCAARERAILPLTIPLFPAP